MNPPPPSRARIDRGRYLALAAADVRARGYVSAADPGREPTWRAALAQLERGEEATGTDVRRAHEILGWVASLHPRDPDGYRANLRACFAQQHLTDEDLPLAASAVRAFNRHLFFEIRGRHRHHHGPEPASARAQVEAGANP